MHGTAGVHENIVEPHDGSDVGDPLQDAMHKKGAALASSDNRLAISLAIVKSRAAEGEEDLMWIDARYQIADCLTMHASRKCE